MNLVKRKCAILEIERSQFHSKDLFSTLEGRNFLMPKDYVDEFVANLKEKGEECGFSRTSLKTLLAVFCPYETPGIYKKEVADTVKISEILTSIDFATLYFLFTQV